MHDELHDVDRSRGHAFRRPSPAPARPLSSLLSVSVAVLFQHVGIVVAGNMAMVFVFWELVGICSYFLIGFYIERKSASNAANKAFIVNRVGDFGMIIGMMALWASLGTFLSATSNRVMTASSNADLQQVRSPENNYELDSAGRHGSGRGRGEWPTLIATISRQLDDPN